MSKYASDYAMITTKIRTLLHKNTKFIWSKDHQDEFDKVIASLSNLDKLEPYHPDNKIYMLVDTSLAGLGFILFKKIARGDLAFYRLVPFP